MSSVRFVGTYTPKLDDKGRLTLPAKFRDALAGGVMVTKGQDHSLSVFRAEEFDEIAARIVEASRNDPQARAFQRYFFASTEEQRPDGQGWIAAPVRNDPGVLPQRQVRDRTGTPLHPARQPDTACDARHSYVRRSQSRQGQPRHRDAWRARSGQPASVSGIRDECAWPQRVGRADSTRREVIR